MAQNKQSLIDDLITFIENERELYGPFSVSPDPKKEELSHQTDIGAGEDNIEANVDTARKMETSTGTTSKETAPDNAPSEPANGEFGFADDSHKNSKTLQEQLKGCSTLNGLRDFCETADELRTDLDNTNLVFGVGNPKADLMIVGEAPGFNEDQQGEPFVGAAGQLLNKILKAIQFDREDVYIANILKHRPPDNRNPTDEERERSLPYLERQIDLVSPKVILCVGKVSGTTLLGRDDALKRMRGQFYDYRGAKLTVTYHPAALLRNPKWKRPVWEDVQQVRKVYEELRDSS